MHDSARKQTVISKQRQVPFPAMPNTNDDRPNNDRLYEDRNWTSTDGLKLHYRDYPADGSAPENALPLLCMHGLTRNARDFAPLAAHIAGRRRMIVPEMRGRGKSDPAKDSATYNPAQYVADVEELLKELSLGKFIAVGTSLGGLMTMLMAAMGSRNIAGAILNDIGPVVDEAGIGRIRGYVGQGGSFPTWMHAARALQEVHRPSYPAFTIDDWLAMAKRGMVVSQSGRIVFDYDKAIAEPFAEPTGAAPPDLWPAFDALKNTPLLLLRGELSDLLSPETVAEMQRRNASMQVVEVPGVGHAPVLDEPAVIAAMNSFLERLP